jgi:predicted nucleotidyltransferase
MDVGKISGILNKSGLSDKEIDAICQVFRNNLAIRRVILFGSRAKGTYKPFSDIDLAIDGLEDELAVAGIALQLEELPLPYKFDVKSLDSITSLPLIEHIERVGITLYQNNA